MSLSYPDDSTLNGSAPHNTTSAWSNFSSDPSSPVYTPIHDNYYVREGRFEVSTDSTSNESDASHESLVCVYNPCRDYSPDSSDLGTELVSDEEEL